MDNAKSPETATRMNALLNEAKMKGFSLSDICRLSGVSYSTLMRGRRGQHCTNKALMDRLETTIRGYVTEPDPIRDELKRILVADKPITIKYVLSVLDKQQEEINSLNRWKERTQRKLTRFESE